MSATATPRAKAGAAPTDVDSIMPLLFATIGNPAISFKKMAAMDPENRTESSLEHKFRKWRQMGREIAEKNPEHAGSFAAATPKKPRAAPAKKGASGKGNSKQPDVGDEEGAVDDEDGVAAVKQECKDEAPLAAANAKTTKASGVKGNKKRSVSKDPESEGGESPTKKAKVTKKGTAKVVKKPAAKARVSLESMSDDGEEEVEALAKCKSRAKAAPKSKGTVKAVEGSEETMNTQTDAVENGGISEMVPMKFEMEA